jgi:hypothetical protein
MVRRRRPAPNLTRSLGIDVPNDDKPPGTLPLGDGGCIPGPPPPPDTPPDSHLPPPHPGWRKIQLSGDAFPQNCYRATCAPASDDDSDGWCTDGNVSTPPPPRWKPKDHIDPSGSTKGPSCKPSGLERPRPPLPRNAFQSEIPTVEDSSDGWVSDNSSNSSSSSSEGERFNRRVRDYYNHGLLVPEQRFDFIEHLSGVVQLLKLSNTTAVYEALVDTHTRDMQLQTALIRILIYIINNDYFTIYGSSMVALWELQATILSNPRVNRIMRRVAYGGDICFPLDPNDSLSVPEAVPLAPRSGPPPVPFHSRPPQMQSPHVSGKASDDVTSLDRTQTLGTTPDQMSGVPKPKTKSQLRRDRRRRVLDTKPSMERA